MVALVLAGPASTAGDSFAVPGAHLYKTIETPGPVIDTAILGQFSPDGRPPSFSFFPSTSHTRIGPSPQAVARNRPSGE